MKAYGWGFKNCVSAEKHTLTDEQIKLLVKLRVNVVFAYDSDVDYRKGATRDDIDNEHTMAQLDSYIREIRTYNCERHIIICSSMIAYAQINNLVIRKKRRENIQDITFHVMDNHLRHRVI